MTIKSQVFPLSIFLMLLLCIPALAQRPLTKEILWTADWSPDGKWIAVGGNLDTLKIYHAKNLKLYQSIPVKNTLTRARWHPTAHAIAVVTQLSGEKSFIMDLTTSEKTPLEGISTEGARAVDWNCKGEYLAVADNDGQLLIYTAKGALIRKISNENTLSITAINWHPSKNVLLTVSDKIRLVDIEGNLLKLIKHRPEDVLLLSVAWHPSGSFFVTGDYGDSLVKSLLQFWDENGQLLRSIDGSKGEYRNISWNPKGNRLATASDALRIWDIQGNLVSEGKSEAYLWGVAWHKNGNRIVTSSLAQEIVLWTRTAKRLLSIE
jgi:WD40 repeat protein